eukprot:TRINITY_DN28681_c0_g1_i1.p2 TRINITY_DN28681_c0_g1~~TRINITY_DN28681_c0_g1_i1.p2  ORF type:complete len:200 (-),score=42.45 TRINITY_DN28681_c0_g1_i1:37-636(-)
MDDDQAADELAHLEERLKNELIFLQETNDEDAPTLTKVTKVNQQIKLELLLIQHEKSLKALEELKIKKNRDLFTKLEFQKPKPGKVYLNSHHKAPKTPALMKKNFLRGNFIEQPYQSTSVPAINVNNISAMNNNVNNNNNSTSHSNLPANDKSLNPVTGPMFQPTDRPYTTNTMRNNRSYYAPVSAADQNGNVLSLIHI